MDTDGEGITGIGLEKVLEGFFHRQSDQSGKFSSCRQVPELSVYRDPAQTEGDFVQWQTSDKKCDR